MFAALATIALGLLVHLAGGGLPLDARDALGDALWASMILWWSGAIAPRAPLAARSVGAYAICAVVEVSQLYHTSALDAVRDTSVGQLVLGSGFDPRDLAAYAAGLAVAALAEAVVRWRRRRARVKP